ncbi:MAG: FAD-binding oxidoreductase, partial [Frankia sp.]|nr:FAD-binding oxidoreductase [Frankia sp.]
VHAGHRPAALRVVDAAESALTGTLASGEAVAIVGVESAVGPVDDELAQLTAILRDHGGRVVGSQDRATSATWRTSFKQAPYLRERLVLLGVLAETFETAATWDRLDALVAAVTDATRDALRRVCGAGVVTCRLTHVYADGAAPYFTALAPARRGSELAQWAEVKAAASDAILAAGGTITHHHAVGRDHRTWYDAQRPPPFAAALAGAKAALDPTGMLNPGVLLDRVARA